MKKTLAWVAVFALVGAQANAAIISWGSAAYLNGGDGTSDVCTTGALVDALNANGSDITVGGVTFKAESGNLISVDGNGYGNFQVNPTTPALDANYNTLLDPARWRATKISISGLTIGQEYCVQIWSCDSRSSGVGRYAIFDGAVTLQSNQGVGTLGQQVVGMFTADETSQDIAIEGFDANGVKSDAGLVNAVEVRAIPEPGTLGLLGGAAAGMFFIRRRRHIS